MTHSDFTHHRSLQSASTSPGSVRQVHLMLLAAGLTAFGIVAVAGAVLTTLL
jgi:hypothetical protein